MATGDEAGELAARLPARLKELRDEAGLSQKGLADRSGVPQATISAYELDRITPAWPAVVKLAHALGVSPAAFLVAAKTEQNPG